MAEKGIWLSTQPFLDDGRRRRALGPTEQAKMQQVVAGTDNVYELAKKYQLKTAFGTDILFSAGAGRAAGRMLAALTRWYTPAEALMMATIDQCRTAGALRPAQSLSRQARRGRGRRAGRPAAGRRQPARRSRLVADPAKNFVVIMKDGKIYKNTVN